MRASRVAWCQLWFSNPDFGFAPGPDANLLSNFPRQPLLPSSSGHAPPAGVISRAQGDRAEGGWPRAPFSSGLARGSGAQPVPRSRRPFPTTRSHPGTAQNDRKHPAPHALAEQLVGCVTQVPACRWRLPSPVRRKDSLLFCASALFLWRGRSRDSSRALASAPCISPMESGGRARSRRGRPENTDVSLKEPP